MKFSFNHNYSTRNTIKNAFKINKYNTEFGKRDPFNIGIHLCMQYDIPIKLFNKYEQYKKYVTHKIKLVCEYLCINCIIFQHSSYLYYFILLLFITMKLELYSTKSLILFKICYHIL